MDPYLSVASLCISLFILQFSLDISALLYGRIPSLQAQGRIVWCIHVCLQNIIIHTPYVLKNRYLHHSYRLCMRVAGTKRFVAHN